MADLKKDIASKRRRAKMLTRSASLPLQDQDSDSDQLGNALYRFNSLSLDEKIALKRAGKLKRASIEEDHHEDEVVSNAAAPSQIECRAGNIIHDKDSSDGDAAFEYEGKVICVDKSRRRRRLKKLTRSASLPLQNQDSDSVNLGNALHRFNSLSLDEKIALKRAGKLKRVSIEEDYLDSDHEEDIVSNAAAPMSATPDATASALDGTIGLQQAERIHDGDSSDDYFDSDYDDKIPCDAAPMPLSLEHEFHEGEETMDSYEKQLKFNLSSVAMPSEAQISDWSTDATESDLEEKLKIAVKSKLNAKASASEKAVDSYEERLRRKLAESAPKPQTWTCNLCTFQNKPATLACEMCNGPKVK
jgi:hypothetical protein